jgi:hypothetical protein
VVVDDQRLGRKEPNMVIRGIDYYPSDQYIAFDTETGECGERRLNHSDGEAWFRTWRRRFKSTRPPTIISALDSQLTPLFRHATHAITMGINGGAE